MEFTFKCLLIHYIIIHKTSENRKPNLSLNDFSKSLTAENLVLSPFPECAHDRLLQALASSLQVLVELEGWCRHSFSEAVVGGSLPSFSLWKDHHDLAVCNLFAENRLGSSQLPNSGQLSDRHTEQRRCLWNQKAPTSKWQGSGIMFSHEEIIIYLCLYLVLHPQKL